MEQTIIGKRSHRSGLACDNLWASLTSGTRPIRIWRVIDRFKYHHHHHHHCKPFILKTDLLWYWRWWGSSKSTSLFSLKIVLVFHQAYSQAHVDRFVLILVCRWLISLMALIYRFAVVGEGSRSRWGGRGQRLNSIPPSGAPQMDTHTHHRRALVIFNKYFFRVGRSVVWNKLERRRGWLLARRVSSTLTQQG